MGHGDIGQRLMTRGTAGSALMQALATPARGAMLAAVLMLGACGDDASGDAGDGGSGGAAANDGAGGVGANGATGGAGGSGASGGAGGAGGSGASGGVGGNGATGGGGGNGANGGAGGDSGNGASGGTGGDSGEGGASGNGDVDAGDGMIRCDTRKLTCKRAAPDCEEGQVPRIIGTCYGECVDITECVCDEPAACPNNDKYTCLNFSQRCSPYL